MTIVNLALINQHFDFLYSSALEVANSQAILSLEKLQLPSLEPDQRVLMIQKEIQLLKLKIEDYNGKEYVRFAADKSFLNKIYVARMLFFECNDERKLREAFILHECLALLEMQLEMAKAETPDLMFVSLPNNAGNLVFRKLEGFMDNRTSGDDDWFENKLDEETLERDSAEIEHLLRRYQISALIGCMVPEPGLINHLFETNARIQSRIKNQRFSLNTISEDIKSAYREIYKMALSSLKHLIECFTNDSMIIYINNQISDIRYMEELAELDGYVLHEYFKHLKHFLKDQLQNMQYTQNIKQTEVKSALPNKENSDHKAFSFEYHSGPKELKSIIQALNLIINLFKGDTAVDDFIMAFTCKDLSGINTTFIIGCQTNQFKYVMDHLADYSTNFTPSSIEKSGLFFSKKGKPITANNLTASNTDNLKRKLAIDNIFWGKH